jgi:hypothetical protein
MSNVTEQLQRLADFLPGRSLEAHLLYAILLELQHIRAELERK